MPEPRIDGASARARGRPRNDGRPPINREQILETARGLFARDGVAATSIRSIAEQLGSHPASIFHHFPTKEHVVGEVAASIYEKALKHFEIVGALTVSADVKLYRLVRDDGLYTASGDGEERRLMLLPELRTSQALKVTAGWIRMRDIYATVLRVGIADRLFRDVDVALTAEMVTAAPMWSIITWTPVVAASPREIGRELARFVLRSLLIDPSRLDDVERAASALRVR